MNITLETKFLVSALARLKGVASRKTTQPILSNVLIQAMPDMTLRLTCSDGDKWLTLYIPVKVKRAGSITLPCAMLHTAVSQMETDELDITVEGDTAKIVSGTRKASIRGLPSQDFPAIPEVSKGHEIVLPGEPLSGWLKRAVRHVSGEEHRPILTGCHLFSHDGQLRIEATDGRRAFVVDCQQPCEGIDAIVPTAACNLIAGLADGEVRLVFHETHLVAGGEGWLLSSKLIEGKFYDISTIIPPSEQVKIEVTVDRQKLLGATAYVGSTDAALKSRSVVLSAAGALVTLSANAGAALDGEDAIERLSGTGDITVGLSPEYLRDALESFSGEIVSLQFVDTRSPMTIRDEHATAAIWLMRVA